MLRQNLTVEQSRYGHEGLGGLPITEVERLQKVRQKDALEIYVSENKDFYREIIRALGIDEPVNEITLDF